MEELSEKNQVNIQKWFAIIHQCRDSGLSNQQWCELNGISLKSYYYWLAKIRNMAVEYIPRKSSVSATSADASADTVFAALPAGKPDPGLTDSVMIHIGCALIEIGPHIPASLIQSVILAVSKC